MLQPDIQVSMFGHRGNEAVMASHLLQYLGQAAEVAVRKMLGLPQVQNDSRRARFGSKVVQIPERGPQDVFPSEIQLSDY